MRQKIRLYDGFPISAWQKVISIPLSGAFPWHTLYKAEHTHAKVAMSLLPSLPLPGE